MTRMWWVLMLAAVVSLGPLAAQEPTVPQDTAEAAQLRQQIEQRFHQIVRQRLALSDDQDAKLRATQERFGAQRRDLMRDQADHRQGLDRQMQPGVATACSSTCRASNATRSGCCGCSRMKTGKWPAT